MTVCPDGCGACCDPVLSPYTKLDVLLGRVACDPETARWVLEDLTPISRRQGLTEVDYLSEGGRTMAIVDGVPTVGWTYFYRCRHFDAEARLCRNYENRPPACRDYPWYGDPPDPNKALPRECAFRADLGQVPVPLVRKENAHGRR